MFVAKCHMVVDEVADRLDPRFPGWDRAEEAPRFFRHSVGFAIAAAKQIDECIWRKVLDAMFEDIGVEIDGAAGLAPDAVVDLDRDAALGSDQRVGGDADAPDELLDPRHPPR